MRDETLSPRRLLEHLHPVLPLDAHVCGPWQLVDAYRLDPGEPVCVELGREGHKPVRIDFEPVPPAGRVHPPMATVAGLDLSYRAPTSPQLGAAACKALAAALEQRLGAEPRRWTVHPPTLDELPREVEAEVSFEPTRFGREPDAGLLARDFDHYERLYGVRPELRAVEVCGRPVRGVSVHYPAARNGRVPNSAAVYASSLRIAHRRRMRRYFGQLGCVFDLGAHARTVPTPTTYARCLRERPELAQVRPRMIAGLSASLRPIHWGAFVRRNVLPVTVAPRWSVELHRRTREIGALANIPCDVGMLVHDMGLHALALHAVPQAAWDELAGEAVARIRARPLSLAMGPWGLLARLAAFFEGPVTTHCWKAWAEADEPESFEQAFTPHFAALRSELAEL